MGLEVINKGSSNLIRPNFKEKELFSKSPDITKTSHTISSNLLDALQYIREWLGSPIVITSTYRTKTHNESPAVGSGEWSNHRKDHCAIDFTALGANQRLIAELKKTSSELWYDLRSKFGISMGVYDTFFHIDDAQGSGVKTSNQFTDDFGTYGFWDNSTLKVMGKDLPQSQEDNRKGNIGLIVLIAVVVFLFRKKIRKWFKK